MGYVKSRSSGTELRSYDRAFRVFAGVSCKCCQRPELNAKWERPLAAAGVLVRPGREDCWTHRTSDADGWNQNVHRRSGGFRRGGWKTAAAAAAPRGAVARGKRGMRSVSAAEREGGLSSETAGGERAQRRERCECCDVWVRGFPYVCGDPGGVLRGARV